MVIPGYSKYTISEDGIITNIKTGYVLHPSIDTLNNGSNTYARVCLRDDHGVFRVSNVLALLARTYLDPPPAPFAVAKAKDGNNLNCVLSNVAWATRTWKDQETLSPASIQHSASIVYHVLVRKNAPMKSHDITTYAPLSYTEVWHALRHLTDAGKVHNTINGFEVIK